MGEFGHELDAASAIAREAGRSLLSYFGQSGLDVREKGALDVVTLADTESEKAIVAALKSAFPDDAIVGEEGTRSMSGVERCWYVDPLDGTFNFARTIPFWCVSIGFVVAGRPSMGVIFDPLRDEMFSAEALGGQVRLNNVEVAPSGATELIESSVQINIDFDREVIDKSLHDTVAVGRQAMRVRNLGSLALQLAYVACGRLDAVVQRRAHAWDYAGAVVLVEESGAVMTRLNGSPFDFQAPDSLTAATPELHHALANLVQP